jgi:hypothetical protein
MPAPTLVWSDAARAHFTGLRLTANQQQSFTTRLQRWIADHSTAWRTGQRYRAEVDVGSHYPVAVNLQVEDRTGTRFAVLLSMYMDA